MVTLGNAYFLDKETKHEVCNSALLKNIVMYFTHIFNILGLNSSPEEIGFTSGTESVANNEELVMPYLTALADFRENVRKEAIGEFLPGNFRPGIISRSRKFPGILIFFLQLLGHA